MFQSVLSRLRDAQSAELEGGGAAEAGFTLIELMVVLLIIAILLAIAIPTFLGVTGSANDRAAQSNLTNGLTEAAAVYQGNNQSFTGISAALVSSAPEFSWVAAGTARDPRQDRTRSASTPSTSPSPLTPRASSSPPRARTTARAGGRPVERHSGRRYRLDRVRDSGVRFDGWPDRCRHGGYVLRQEGRRSGARARPRTRRRRPVGSRGARATANAV